jgi:Na+/proline symporter
MSFIDLLIIIVYLTVVVGVGVRYRGKQDNTRDYFTTQGGFAGVLGSIIDGIHFFEPPEELVRAMG